MAFYGYYNGHTDDFYSTPYQSSEYNKVPTPFQASFSPSSWYEFNEPKVSEYDYFITPSASNYMVYTEPESIQCSAIENHYSDNEYYGWYVNPSAINYSVYHCTMPKLLQYDPSLSSETNANSISTQEFNAPEFKEYSPNPYEGGYDPITTYGRPLSPSDEICYPRSTPRSDIVMLDGFDYGSTPSPYGKDDLNNLSTKLPIINEEIDKKTDLETDVLENRGDITGTGAQGVNLSSKLPIINEEIDKKTDLETDVLENRGDITGIGAQGKIGEPVQSTPSDNSHNKHDDDVFENGRNGDYDDKIGMQTAYGSGLEAIDLCETIFGYWPCLDKIERQQRDKFREICDQDSTKDPWKIAADYLFGSPLTYKYENHHLLQHHHQQIQYESYENNLWLPEV